MRKRKIDLEKLKEMLIDGKSAKYCSEFFKVSPAAISKARKNINVAVVKNVALESAPAVVEKNLNVIEQLQGINEHANWLLDQASDFFKPGMKKPAMIFGRDKNQVLEKIPEALGP